MGPCKWEESLVRPYLGFGLGWGGGTEGGTLELHGPKPETELRPADRSDAVSDAGELPGPLARVAVIESGLLFLLVGAPLQGIIYSEILRAGVRILGALLFGSTNSAPDFRNYQLLGLKI